VTKITVKALPLPTGMRLPVRSAHYEGVPVRCSRAQSPPKLHVLRLLLVAIVGY